MIARSYLYRTEAGGERWPVDYAMWANGKIQIDSLKISDIEQEQKICIEHNRFKHSDAIEDWNRNQKAVIPAFNLFLCWNPI